MHHVMGCAVCFLILMECCLTFKNLFLIIFFLIISCFLYCVLCYFQHLKKKSAGGQKIGGGGGGGLENTYFSFHVFFAFYAIFFMNF